MELQGVMIKASWLSMLFLPSNPFVRLKMVSATSAFWANKVCLVWFTIFICAKERVSLRREGLKDVFGNGYPAYTDFFQERRLVAGGGKITLDRALRVYSCLLKNKYIA